MKNRNTLGRGPVLRPGRQGRRGSVRDGRPPHRVRGAPGRVRRPEEALRPRRGELQPGQDQVPLLPHKGGGGPGLRLEGAESLQPADPEEVIGRNETAN